MERKSRKGIKKLMCMLLAFVMTISLIPGGFARPDNASAEDTRTKVYIVRATSNYEQLFGHGKTITTPTFTVTEGIQAYIPDSMVRWQKKNDQGNWVNVYNGVFTPGTWRVTCQVRIDGGYGTTHVLANSAGLYVNSVVWNRVGTTTVGENFSYNSYNSPEMTVTDELVFNNDDSYDIPAGEIGYGIETIYLFNAIWGGTAPYTFSKVSGPNWVNVSSNGTITGSRPYTAQKETYATIQVEDATGDTETIRIKVGAVERMKVSEIEATSNYSTILTYGKALAKPDFTITKGTEAHVPSGDMYWQKKNDQGYWKDVYNGNFTEGTWRLCVRIRIDGVYGKTYELNRPTTLTVDRQTWSGGTFPILSSDYSWDWFYSPEVTFEDTGNLTFYDDDNYDIPKGTVGQSIESDNFSRTVLGGTKPYTFSKVSGPDWIEVSSDGAITGTRPDEPQEETSAIIQVMDADNATKSIEIKVGKVAKERIKVSEIEATSNIDTIFRYGMEVTNPTFTMTKGTGVGVYEAQVCWQKKKSDGNWETVDMGNFTIGTWRFIVRIGIDGEYGTTHVLDTPTTLKVDGKRWSVEEATGIHEEFSTAGYRSPEMTIGVVSVLNGTADYDTAITGNKVTIKADEAPAGKLFDKWVVDRGDVTLEDPESKTTTFVMGDSSVGVKATYKEVAALNSVTGDLYGYDDIKASWDKLEGVTGYKVYYKKSTSKVYKYKGSTTKTYAKFVNLTDGAKYYVKVVPYVEADGKTVTGKGKVSSGIYTLKKLNTPTVTKKSSSKVTVKWNNIYGETGYQISKSTSKTKTGTIYTVKTTTGKSKIISAKKGKTYYYKVRAYKKVDGKGIYGPWSNVRAYKLK